jgi:hypothetical protein
LSSSVEKEQRSITTAVSEDHGDVAAKQRRPCGLEPAERVRTRPRQEPLRHVELACLKAQLRCGERTLRSLTFVGCQSDRSLQKRGRGGHASPRLRAAGASFELSRNLFVRGRGGRGQMPGPAVRVDVRVCRLGQCKVHAPALIDRRRSVHRGANERMTERHRLLDREQPVDDVSRTSVDP